MCSPVPISLRELESWVSHVKVSGSEGDGGVTKLLTRRVQTLMPGHTIGDVDFVLRRPHLTSVIVKSPKCELVREIVRIHACVC
jgi:hypothetical protein